MKDFENNSKTIAFFRMYMLAFTILNILYLYLETYKSKLTGKLILSNNISKLEFDKIADISNVTISIEGLLILLMLAFVLINIITKEDNLKILKLLLVQLVYIIFFYFIGFLLSKFFSAPIGNLTQQLYIITLITLLALLYYRIKTLF